MLQAIMHDIKLDIALTFSHQNPDAHQGFGEVPIFPGGIYKHTAEHLPLVVPCMSLLSHSKTRNYVFS